MGEFNEMGSLHRGSTPPQGDLEILLVTSSFPNRDKLQLNGTLWPKADLMVFHDRWQQEPITWSMQLPQIPVAVFSDQFEFESDADSDRHRNLSD